LLGESLLAAFRASGERRIAHLLHHVLLQAASTACISINRHNVFLLSNNQRRALYPSRRSERSPDETKWDPGRLANAHHFPAFRCAAYGLLDYSGTSGVGWIKPRKRRIHQVAGGNAALFPPYSYLLLPGATGDGCAPAASPNKVIQYFLLIPPLRQAHDRYNARHPAPNQSA